MEYFFSIFQGIWIMILLDFCPLHTTFQWKKSLISGWRDIVMLGPNGTSSLFSKHTSECFKFAYRIGKTKNHLNTYSDLSILKMEPCAKWGNNQSGQLVSEGHCLGKLWTEVLTPRLHLFVASFYGTQPHQRSKRPPLHSPHAWSTCVKTSCGGRHSYKSKEALIIHQSQSRTIQYQGVSTLKSGNSENKILLSLREENRVLNY